MIYPKPVVEIMQDVVTAVQTAQLANIQALQLAQMQIETPDATQSDIVSIQYLFGHYNELIATLQEKQKSPIAKDNIWPVIMLFTDIPEQYGNPGGYYQDVTLDMVIAYCSKPDLKAADRLEKNFKPILFPLYQELMKQIANGGQFVCQNQKGIKHTKYDRYYWGKTGLYGGNGNTFNDYIDAIEIKNLILKVNNQKTPFSK